MVIARCARASAASVAAAFLATGCTDVDPSGPSGAMLPASLRAVPVDDDTSDVASQARFVVKIDVRGTLRPGAPVRVRVTYTGVVPTREMTASVSMPEVEIARLNGWRAGVAPVARSLSRLAEVVRPIDVGEHVVLEHEVTIQRAGYYRVAATARAAGNEAPIGPAGLLRDAEYREVWLLIDERGGRITPTFEPALLGDSVHAQPGVLRPRGTRAAHAGADGNDTSERRAVIEAPIRQLVYYDRERNGLEPAPDVTLQWVYVDAWGNLQGSASVRTDANGVYRGPCVLAGFVTASVTWSMSDDDVEMINSGGWAESDCDQTFRQVQISPEPVWVWITLRQFVPFSRSLLGVSRPRIRVGFESGGNGGAFYRPSEDRIKMGDSTVFFGYGRFVTAHEYGHAIHERALNGNWAAGGCPSPHNLNGYYSLQCALSEGFANFLGAASQNVYDARPFYGYIVRRQQFGSWLYEPGRNATIQEAAVGAMLYDFADSPGGDDGADEPWDTVEGGTQVAATMRQCGLRLPSGQVVGPRGADDFVFCAERVITPSIQSQFFPTRPVTTRAQQLVRNAPAFPWWPSSGIRTVWRHNLWGLP
ncbi:MAG: hypothetical protein MUF00_17515 [Gemmatimonadaceae bacterium]|jgi:hypothetical protein|nr:hypothetical protein [Gemmatimonadaceae bacterium]